MDAGAIEQWVVDSASSPWLFPAIFGLVVLDAFLVIVPSETAVVALGTLAATTGHPLLIVLVPVVALGAVVGDLLCFLIGRAVGTDRWAWQRRGRIATALERARATVLDRTAVLVFTARYIPYARIAVNLSAGAAGLRPARFLPLSAAAGTGWALYNTAIGAFFGTVLRDQPLVAIALSIAVAIALGLAIDGTTRAVVRRRAARAAAAVGSIAPREGGSTPAPATTSAATEHH